MVEIKAIRFYAAMNRYYEVMFATGLGDILPAHFTDFIYGPFKHDISSAGAAVFLSEDALSRLQLIESPYAAALLKGWAIVNKDVLENWVTQVDAV